MAARRSWLLRFALGAALVLLLLLVLLGRGLGLLPASKRAGPASTTAPPAEPAVTAAAAPGPETALLAGLDDRGAAIATAARAALVDGRLGAAFGALRSVRQVEAGRAPAAVQALDRLLRQGLDHACAELAIAVAAGEIGPAERRLDALLQPEAREVLDALDALAHGRGWPSLHATGRSDGAIPAATPLPADRAVHWLDGDGAAMHSRIVALHDGMATLRQVGRNGVTFPSVPWWSLDPDAPTAAEAAELGLAALAAGRLRRARLWCSCSLARAGVPLLRVEQLRALLP